MTSNRPKYYAAVLIPSTDDRWGIYRRRAEHETEDRLLEAVWGYSAAENIVITLNRHSAA